MSLSEQIKELEHELERLKKSQPDLEAYDKLVDLIAPDIEWKEKNLGDRAGDRMKEIITAYRAVRPK